MNLLLGKRSMMIAVFLLIISFSSQLVQSQVLLLAGEEEMLTCAVYNYDPYPIFDIYVFLITDSDGALQVWYQFVAPPGHIVVENAPAPFVSEIIYNAYVGPPGMAFRFASCQTGTMWVWKYTMVSMNSDPAHYVLEPHEYDYYSEISILTCENSYRFCTALNWFGFNDDCPFWISNQESSWGAVKGLYR